MVLLVVVLFCHTLKSGQGFVPEVREVVAQQGEPFGIQLINSARAVAAVADQARLSQTAQMLGDGGARYGQSCREFVNRARMSADHLKDGQASGVAESGEAVVNVSIHLR